jgi:transposase-like protein
MAPGADQLRPKIPKLAALMDEAESDVLDFMSFPKDHRPKLHSVNPLERCTRAPLPAALVCRGR